MKKFALLCALMLCSLISAQPLSSEPRTGSVSGKILDASLNEPLPYVNIIVKNDANETITGGISLDDGTFNISKIPAGKVIVTIQYIGFKTISKAIEIGNNVYDVDLGNILLEEDIANLDEVTVVAEVSTIQQ
ncbi:MAG: carboxypeptidase-like regulatory domain-containing protein, partial [Flavobacteriales bacterium]|nr:carboxypeptidase-like regulatory domain-containing protein [Flavobacteriales bacterium]